MSKTATKQKDSIATKQRQEYLKTLLTPEEVAKAANELAKLLDDTQAIESELVSIKASFKAKLEKCDADLRVQQRLVRDKYEYRNIECDVIYDYSKLTVQVIRKDTAEIVEDRKMTAGERQMEVDFDTDEE